MSIAVIDIFEVIQVSYKEPASVFGDRVIQLFKGTVVDKIGESVFLSKIRKGSYLFFFFLIFLRKTFGVVFSVLLFRVRQGLMNVNYFPAAVCIFE